MDVRYTFMLLKCFLSLFWIDMPISWFMAGTNGTLGESQKVDMCDSLLKNFTNQ